MTAAPAKDSAAYAAQKERSRAAQAEQSRAGRNIGAIPPVANPERRAACEKDLAVGLKTYFPNVFTKSFSAAHFLLIENLQRVLTEGGQQAIAMPRGDGKTAICTHAAILAVLYGWQVFLLIIAANKHPLAERILKSIKTELTNNELLFEDFPEALFAIRALDGMPQRAGGQLFGDKRTEIEWTADSIVFPTIPGSKCSGSVIAVAGIDTAIRGMHHKRADGSVIRPTCVLADDPQTRESAKSIPQTHDRCEAIEQDIMGLAGPDIELSILMPCTIIRNGDLASQYLSHELHPEFNGIVVSRVKSWPTNLEIWKGPYDEERKRSALSKNPKHMNDFYLAHREEMDAGCVLDGLDRCLKSEISAIQSAMNLWLKNPVSFAAEMQNRPLLATGEDQLQLTAEIVKNKLSRIARGIVPDECHVLTSFWDVQDGLLYWGVCAWDHEFSGSLIDYGTWPKQPKLYFKNSEAYPNFDTVFAHLPTEARKLAALEALEKELLIDRVWRNQSGEVMNISKCLIDSGAWSKVVKNFCRNAKSKAVLMPSKGMGYLARHVPMNEAKRKSGEDRGDHWQALKPLRGEVRTVNIDANYYKTALVARLMTPRGAPGCFTLFGSEPGIHAMLADHLLAESSRMMHDEKSGRRIEEWKELPGKPDNHMLDVLVGCLAAAAMCGVKLKAAGDEEAKDKKPARAWGTGGVRVWGAKR